MNEIDENVFKEKRLETGGNLSKFNFLSALVLTFYSGCDFVANFAFLWEHLFWKSIFC